MVHTKHCCYGTCNSNSRYADRPDMQEVFFINFTKPKSQREKCNKWIRRSGRPKEQFNVDRVQKNDVSILLVEKDQLTLRFQLQFAPKKHFWGEVYLVLLLLVPGSTTSSSYLLCLEIQRQAYRASL